MERHASQHYEALREHLALVSPMIYTSGNGVGCINIGLVNLVEALATLNRKIPKSGILAAEFLIRVHQLGLRIGEMQVAEVQRRSRPRIGGTAMANLRILKALVISLMITLRPSITRSRIARSWP